MNTTAMSADRNFRSLPRRRFSKEEKHQIVREFLHLGIPLARFARERDLHYNQLSRWRKEYLAGEYGPVSALRSPDLQWIPMKVKHHSPQSSTAVATVAEGAECSREQGEEMLNLERLHINLPKGTLLLEGKCSAALLRTILVALQ